MFVKLLRVCTETTVLTLPCVQRWSSSKQGQARQLQTATVCHSTSSASSPTQSPSIIYATAAGSRHDMPGHSECAARIPAILSALDTAKLTSQHRSVQVCKILQSSLECIWTLLLGTHHYTDSCCQQDGLQPLSTCLTCAVTKLYCSAASQYVAPAASM